MAISSNVIYVEPNYSSNYKQTYTSTNEFGEEEQVEKISSYEMAPPLEDYCIAFQLAVEVPAVVHSSNVTTDNTVYVLSYENKANTTAVSLLQGTKRLGTNWNYLTTAALETTLEDVKKASPTEMFGVKSIDIEYDSWMCPQITMKFTDIRGASVFVPEELKHPHNGLADDNIQGSFFRCFFVTPYPLFGLVVKGFYGEAVSYELMYSKFTYKLDSSTGNYEAEAKFIGYSWSILADITLNAVAAAPYCSYKGEEYWKEQVENGVFVSREGTPLPKLPQIINSYKKLGDATQALSQLDTTVQENSKLEENNTNYTILVNNVEEIVTQLTNILVKAEQAVPLVEGNPKYGFVCAINSGGINYILSLPNGDGSNVGNLLKELRNQYKAAPTKFKTSLNENNEGEIGENDYNLEVVVDNNGEVVDTVIAQAPVMGNSTVGTINLSVGTFHNEDTRYLAERKASVKLLQKPSTKVKFLYVDVRDWYDTMNAKISNTASELEQNQEEMKAKLQLEVANAIGMAPTLYNIVKVMMAHLETLIYCVLKCSEAIPQGRTFTSTKLNETNYVDECSVKSNSDSGVKKEDSEDETLPPFPSVKVKKKRDGRTVVEDDWLGDLSTSDELEEVKLINELILAVNKLHDDVLVREEDAYMNEDGTKGYLKCAIPVVPSDIFLEYPIWQTSTWDMNNCAEFLGALALRASYLMFAMQDCAINANVCGKLDAHNFNHDLGNTIPPKWRQFILGGCESASDFANKAKDIVFNNGSDGKASFLKNIPWAKNSKDGLLDGNGNPRFPEVKNKEGEICYCYPIQKISFHEEGFGGEGGKTSNNRDVFTIRNGYWVDDNEGKSSFKFIGNPNTLSGISSDFEREDETIKSIDNYEKIQDNFNPLKEYVTVNNEAYKDMFGNDNYVRADANHRGFCETFSSKYNNAVNDFKPAKSSYILPNSKTAAENCNISSFGKGDENPIKKSDYTKVKIDSGNGDKILERDRGINIKSFFKEKNINLEKWTIPLIAGLNTDGQQIYNCSIFAQTSYINAIGGDHSKAIQFLLAMTNGRGGLDLNDCWEKLLQAKQNGKGMFKVVPYFALLLLGGYYFYCENKDNFKRRDDKISFIEEVFTEKKKNIFNGNNIDTLRRDVQCYLMDEFNSWVIGKQSKISGIANYMSFKEIDAELALNVCVSDIVNDGGIYTILKDGKSTMYGSVEKFLASKLGDNFFKNYLSISIGKNENDIILYTRETSDVIKKLTFLFVQPVLFVPFTEWLNKYIGNMTIWDNQQRTSQIEDYFKGFYEEYKKIILPNTEGTSSGVALSDAGDLDKHVRISLYNYIKILYDRWLSAKLFKSNVHEHWGIKEFFEEHFHFMDQFYVDCKDIFFDMDGMAKDFEHSFTQDTFTLLSFMENALAATKCVMYPVQNFLDYYKEDCAKKMNNLFKPLSYVEAFTDAPKPNEIYPDFVILYSSEPSSKPSDSECEDSMMLNYDEEFLPYPIRTNPGNEPKKRIPAFGVTYGKQYQSYFHSIDVGTETPIPTEQSLKTQYMIAGMNSKNGTESGQRIQCMGQDLYTVYSKQSYTCTVQMMGDMWIQPTMYFVLTNVPTFRGSYIVQKVTHSITPGKMTTTFMGTRMASTSQPHVYNWFVGKSSYGSGVDSAEDDAARRADITNDCPYKFFTPGASSGSGTWTDEMLNATVEQFVQNSDWESDAAKTKATSYYNKCKDFVMLDLLGYTAWHEGGIRPDIYKQLQLTAMFNWYTNGIDGAKPKSIRRWLMHNIIMHDDQAGKDTTRYKEWLALKQETRNHCKDLARSIFMNSPAILIGQPITDKNDKYHYEYTQDRKFTPSAKVKALYGKTFTLTYENLSKVATWWWAAEASYGSGYCVYTHEDALDWDNAIMYDGTAIFIGYKNKDLPKWELVQRAETDTLASKLLEVADAVQKTCSFSESVNIGKIYTRTVIDDDNAGAVYISAHEDMKTASKENAILFDIINTTYKDYINDIRWVVKDSNSIGEFPTCIWIKKEKNKVCNAASVSYHDGTSLIAVKDNITDCPSCKGTLNEYFYRSLAKRFLNGSTLGKDFFRFAANYLDYKEDKSEQIVGLLSMYAPESCGGISTVISNACCDES